MLRLICFNHLRGWRDLFDGVTRVVASRQPFADRSQSLQDCFAFFAYFAVKTPCRSAGLQPVFLPGDILNRPKPTATVSFESRIDVVRESARSKDDKRESAANIR